MRLADWGWALTALVEVILVAVAVPLVIVLLGLPVVLLMRLVIEIAQRF
jgi:hypothetical protein